MKLSPVVMIFAIVFCIAVNVFSAYYSNRREEIERPRSILSRIKQAAGVYAKKNGRFPPNLAELETVWKDNAKDDAKNEPKMFTDPNITSFFYENSSYRYYCDSTGQVVGIWLVPKGKYRHEYNTLFVLLANRREGIREEIWKGAALSEEAELLIPDRAVPGAKELSLLGMNKQKSELAPLTEKKNGFSFPFFK